MKKINVKIVLLVSMIMLTTVLSTIAFADVIIPGEEYTRPNPLPKEEIRSNGIISIIMITTLLILAIVLIMTIFVVKPNQNNHTEIKKENGAIKKF